jgi:hypothetical protein
MSFITGTNTELIYASTTPGTAKNTFTTEVAINDTAGMGIQASIPPFFFGSRGSTNGQGLRIIARGILSSTSTVTYQFLLRMGAAAATTAAPIILGCSAVTTGTTVTNQPFQFEGEFIMRTPAGAVGQNSTGIGIGMFYSPGIASPFMAPLWGNNSGGTVVTSPGTAAIDTSIQNYFNFNCICGTSNAANSVTLQSLLVFGLN